MDDFQVEAILRVVESIPEGRVATYGDVGKAMGESSRNIGKVMALWGANVPWWRICNAKGEIPGHSRQATVHWGEERTPVRGVGESARVVLAQVRMSLQELEDIYSTIKRDLAQDPCGQ